MMMQYGIEQYADENEFLSLLAIRLGKLKKGGRPDTNKAAKSVLQDWNKYVVVSLHNHKYVLGRVKVVCILLATACLLHWNEDNWTQLHSALTIFSVVAS